MRIGNSWRVLPSLHKAYLLGGYRFAGMQLKNEKNAIFTIDNMC